MSMPRFQSLVQQMPKIAKVINQFDSPEMQREVLQALLRAFESDEGSQEHDGRGKILKGVNGNGHVRGELAPAFVSGSGLLESDHDGSGEDSSIHD